MKLFKNLYPAWICLLFSLNLISQNTTEIKFNGDQNPTSKVAQAIKDAKNSGAVFSNFQVLEVSKEQHTSIRSKMNGKVQVLEADPTNLDKLLKEAPEFLSLSVPKNEREFVKLQLIRVNLLDESFNVFTSSQEKIPFNFTRGNYYRGVIEGNENNSIASISIFENEIIGSFTDEEGNMIIQPSYTGAGELILYNDKDIPLEFPFECFSDQLEKVQKPVKSRGTSAAGDCIRVYIECDYALYLNKGSTSNTINWITAVFNNVATLYANESINTAISEIYVWTSQDGYSKTSSITALNQFKAARPSFNGNLAHLAALGGNNIGGVAWVDVLCTNYRYAYSNISSSYQNVPTFSWTVEVMTHEMGHNVGSNHTQWCGWTGGALDNCYTTEGGCPKGPPPTNGGTIMSYCHLTQYGINFTNGFGPQPGDKIRAEVVSANCLSSSCGGSCGTPTGLAISNITQSTATATWNSVSGATSYQFEYKKNSDNTWTVQTTSSTSYNMTGLTASTLYNTRVKAICSSGSSSYSSNVNFTTASGGTCGTPTGLAISNITQTTATSTWNAVSGATSYQFEYKRNIDNTWTIQTTGSTGFNMVGLIAATLYDTRVKAICSSGSSAYSSIVNFTTLSGGGTCGTPTGLAISNITQTTATGSWNAVSGALSYQFEYKRNVDNTWIIQATGSTSYNMIGLVASTLYDTRVKAICASGSSAYSATVNFTTASGGSCGTPTNFNVTNITSNSALVSWSPVSGATAYNLQYKLASGNTWSQSTVFTTSVTLNGLAPATSYSTRVQAVCGSNQSAFTSVITFTTTSSGYCASRGLNSNYEWIKRVNLGSIDRNSGKDGGYFNATNLSTDIIKGSTYTINYQCDNTGSSGTLYWRVWIDFNNNSSFDDSGEMVVSVASNSKNLLSSNFTVPTGAATANVRMRVSLKYGGFATSCMTFTYGEVEDYTVNIKPSGGGIVIDPNSDKEHIENVNLYPNPFNNELNLEFEANQDQDVQLMVHDPLGKVIISKSLKAIAGKNNFVIESSQFVPATYMVRIKSTNEIFFRKILKLE